MSELQKLEIMQQLLKIGFDSQQAEEAWQNSDNKSLEGIISWMEINQNSKKQNNAEEENKVNVEQEGLPISDKVNQNLAKQLIEMNFSKNVAEKSLFITGNSSVEAALNWIDEHSYDYDFEEELRIIEKKPLTEEEKKQKMLQLEEKIKKMREEKIKKEQLEEEEREKNRVLGGKNLTNAKRVLEEQQVKRQMDLQKKQKLEDQLAMEQMKQQLLRDKEERFGKKYNFSTGQEILKQKEKDPFEKVQNGLNQIMVAHPPNLFPGMAKTAFYTIGTFIQNIIKNPQEEKFRRINLSNENFQKRVGSTISGIQVLQDCGFEEENGFLILHQVNMTLLQQVAKYIESNSNNF